MGRPGEFDFLSESEAARLGRRVDALQPAAPDGQSWEAQVVRLALELCPPGHTILPSQIRGAAEQLGLVPHDPKRWGVVFAKLRHHGFVRTTEEATSPTASRNAAKENVWRRAV